MSQALKEWAMSIILTELPTLKRMNGFEWIARRNCYESGDPIGRGSTEQEAIDDLNDQENLK